MKHNVPFDPAWRAQARWKRVFYARYMKWLEWLGFVVVAAIIGGFIFAFNYRVDDVVKADGVELRFAGTDVTAEMDAFVGRVLVEDFSMVKKDQAVLELLPIEPGATSVVVTATADGTFVKAAEGRVAAGDVIYRLVDPSQVTFSATLTGDSIAKADVGQTARLKDIAIGSGSVTLRARTGDEVVVTRDAAALSIEGLGDYAIRLQDDRPLAIKGIKSAELDVAADWTPSDVSGTPFPAFDNTAKGEVVTATPLATVQVGEMPEAWQKAFLEQVQGALADQTLRAPSGEAGRLSNLRDFKAVLKLTASDEASETATFIKGTKVDRSCEVDAVLTNPHPAILDALRAGKKVTAKVEVVTGNRPIAFILLKRS